MSGQGNAGSRVKVRSTPSHLCTKGQCFWEDDTLVRWSGRGVSRSCHGNIKWEPGYSLVGTPDAWMTPCKHTHARSQLSGGHSSFYGIGRNLRTWKISKGRTQEEPLVTLHIDSNSDSWWNSGPCICAACCSAHLPRLKSQNWKKCFAMIMIKDKANN